MMRCFFATRFWLLVLAILSLGGRITPVHAGINTSGNIDPSDPSTWTGSTHGYIGKTLDGTLRIDGGSDVLAYYSYVGNDSGITGAVTVDGNGSTWTTGRNLLLGMSGRGTLSILNGGSVSSGGIEGNTSYGSVIAWLAGSTGDATVDGIGSTWTSNCDFNVGYSGSGTLSITNGGSVSSGFSGTYNFGSYIGTNAKSTGGVTVDGSDSTWTNNWLLDIGHKGTGLLSITNGGAVSSSFGYIGCYSGSTGTVTVDGTNSTWTNANDLSVGRSGNGTLNIINGGAVTVGGTTYVAYGESSTGTITFGTKGGTLTTASLVASASQLTGSGTIMAHGLVSDVDLVFDSTASLKQTLTFSSNNKNIAIKLDMTGGSSSNGALGTGYQGKGSLRILDGTKVYSQCGYIGYKSGSTGEVTVDGKDSTWANSADLTVGCSGSGTLNIANGGAVSGANVSINSSSLLTMDVGKGSSLTVGSGMGTFTNDGTARIVAGADATAGTTYSPISAGIWTGSGTYQALGGTWSKSTAQKDYTFTASSVTSGSAGTAIAIDLASVQRILATDSLTGKSIGASFAATTESVPLTITAAAITAKSLSLLESNLAIGESVLSGWTLFGNGYTDGDPVYLSIEVGSGYSSDSLDLWHFNGITWVEYSASDLAYDGTYASFTVNGFSGYAVSAPEPGTFVLLLLGAFGLAVYKLRRLKTTSNLKEFCHGIEIGT